MQKTMATPDDAVMDLTRARQVRSLLSTILTSDENEILRMYYGFEGESYSFERISKELHFSRKKVQEKMNEALEKLRDHPQAEPLRELLRDYL